MKGGVILEILLSRPHRCEFAIHTPGGFSAVRRAAAIDGVMSRDDGPASSESDEAADDLGVGRRTYYCQVDSEIDMNRWISAIANAPPPPEDGEDKGLDKGLVMGTMEKRGGSHLAWQQRFFVLDCAARVCSYFGTAKDFHAGKPPKGKIPLEGPGGKIEILLSGPSHFRFALHPPGRAADQTEPPQDQEHAGDRRIFFLQVSSAEEMNRWIDALDMVMSGPKAFTDGEERGLEAGSEVGGLRTERKQAREVTKSKTIHSSVATTGFLRKRGQGNTAFKTRFFVLEKGRLAYYDNEVAYARSEAPKGHIILGGNGMQSLPSVQVLPTAAGRFDFAVHTPADSGRQNKGLQAFANLRKVHVQTVTCCTGRKHLHFKHKHALRYIFTAVLYVDSRSLAEAFFCKRRTRLRCSDGF